MHTPNNDIEHYEWRKVGKGITFWWIFLPLFSIFSLSLSGPPHSEARCSNNGRARSLRQSITRFSPAERNIIKFLRRKKMKKANKTESDFYWASAVQPFHSFVISSGWRCMGGMKTFGGIVDMLRVLSGRCCTWTAGRHFHSSSGMSTDALRSRVCWLINNHDSCKWINSDVRMWEFSQSR